MPPAITERSTKINCPTCGNELDVEKILGEQHEQQLRREKAKLEADFKQKESALAQQEADLKQKEKEQAAAVEKLAAEQAQKELARFKKEIAQQEEEKALSRYEVKLQSLSEEAAESKKQLQELKTAQIDNEKLKRQLDAQKQESELQIEKLLAANDEENRKKFNEERKLEAERIRKETEEQAKQTQQKQFDEFQKTLRERDKQLADAIQAAEDIKRKAEQKSQQLQGEVQELILKEELQAMYPVDTIIDVPKGVHGADIVQSIRNRQGTIVGMVIYESKRTKSFDNGWIEKLKSDSLLVNKEGLPMLLMIITETLPKDLEHFGQKEGVWVCPWNEFKSLVPVLRESLLKISEAYISQENKGEKKEMLYNYLSSAEFFQQITAIVEGFSSFKIMLEMEKKNFDREYAKKLKLLDKILLNTNHFIGSVQGITGSDIPRLSLPKEETLMISE